MPYGSIGGIPRRLEVVELVGIRGSVENGSNAFVDVEVS